MIPHKTDSNKISKHQFETTQHRQEEARATYFYQNFITELEKSLRPSAKDEKNNHEQMGTHG